MLSCPQNSFNNINMIFDSSFKSTFINLLIKKVYHVVQSLAIKLILVLTSTVKMFCYLVEVAANKSQIVV